MSYILASHREMDTSGKTRNTKTKGFQGAVNVNTVNWDDVNEEASTGDAIIHELDAYGPRKFLTIAVDCEAAVDFTVDFSDDDGETYEAASQITIQMDGAGSDIRNIVLQNPAITHVKVTPSTAGTYTIRTIVSNVAPEIAANVLVGGVAVDNSNPVPVRHDYDYKQTTADVQVKAGAGFLHTLTFSQADAAPTAGTIIVYDSLSETGTVIYKETFTTDVFRAYTVTLDVAFSTGLYIGFTTTADVSVTASYK